MIVSFVGCFVDKNMDQTSLHVALSRPYVVPTQNVLRPLLENLVLDRVNTGVTSDLGVEGREDCGMEGFKECQAEHPESPAHEMSLVLGETGILWPCSSEPFRLKSKRHPNCWPHLLAVLEEVL